MLFVFLHPLDTKAGLQTFAVVYVLFPFKLLHRVSGKPLVTELKVLLLLGVESDFLFLAGQRCSQQSPVGEGTDQRGASTAWLTSTN